MAGGFTAHKPDEDKNYETKSHLIEKIIVALEEERQRRLCWVK